MYHFENVIRVYVSDCGVRVILHIYHIFITLMVNIYYKDFFHVLCVWTSYKIFENCGRDNLCFWKYIISVFGSTLFVKLRSKINYLWYQLTVMVRSFSCLSNLIHELTYILHLNNMCILIFCVRKKTKFWLSGSVVLCLQWRYGNVPSISLFLTFVGIRYVINS